MDLSNSDKNGIKSEKYLHINFSTVGEISSKGLNCYSRAQFVIKNNLFSSGITTQSKL